MPTMNARASNLSLPQYGYDLVVATTQDAVNATTKEFLSAFTGKEFVACYKFVDEGHQAEPLDYNEVKRAIGGTDPFTIRNGDNQNPKLKALDDLGFEFAFRAKMGLPPGLAPTAIPDVVVLDQGSATVTYQLFFAEFDILVLDERRRALFWTNLSQPSGAPWVFKFNVSLDMRTGGDTAFSKLPPGVQEKVKNLNPGSAFSVQQLYLDLNTAGLQSAPDIVGLDKSSTAYVALTRIFLNTYWRKLQEARGDVLLGYTVTPDKPNPRTPSLVPTDLTIEVSPNVDAEGHATKKYELYTLDYLVMSDNHVLPAPVPFNWNWVSESEEADFHGAMAIKKARFASYLNQVLSPSLNQICVVPHCTVSFPDLPPPKFKGIKFTASYSREGASQTYRIVSDGSSKVLTFSYENKSSDEGVSLPLWGKYSFNCSTQSEVFLENNVIRTSTLFNCHVFINAEGFTTEGNYARFKVDTSYLINVDSQGNLVVKLAEGSPKLDDQSETPDPNFILKLFSGGQITSDINKLKGFLSGIRNFLTGHDQSILNIINGSSAWVFPGAQTFVYKDIYFSDHQDLVTHITYVDPT
ncbi:MAG: hypothetical protein DMF64_00540 [Acidobacteria bacterium]|nr:MAG: hypothetical protein DMF64_00540 [Acidobacteriota bacterium]